ncbi:cytochrome c family protein [Tenacibaculum finnmarkense]|uniref:cytochrome c family protein n=1 Tax=Tenacibaculum finnmarkense TaxID=2781243 RepID=UPI001E537C4A|nr:cytochrome c family protein [Tenacibaculum finnmarkense]MCD8399989.1 cytochrome c family protein [Tenacibaculum finnmarkense genomovar ulcerans]MCD8422706.1 cytochrome c family protein [Tenacibaculum finnmarkense genomovar ulcerans]MCG8238709.1 cytochrome C [Tenacibaculum finnmarkense genomovar ulcerans]MCG8785404.1 cytochrome C [Tenacibaculum finnmarkense]MCG8795416.1 cytochrome C [Tenacibaculum finnmarkense]
MKHKNYIKQGWFLGIVFLLIITSCKHKKDEYHSVTDKIEAKSKHYKGTSISSEKYTANLKLVEVTENGITFSIPDRKGAIKSYACTECHSKPLQKMQEKDIKKAHWNIKLNHADANTMSCTTCHNGNNMDNLKSITGHAIDFNNSYKLCSQCHQKQYKDWTGGAHGKRIGSWAPPRASMTCVNCHNPHSPGFDTRWPAKFNTQIEKERK